LLIVNYIAVPLIVFILTRFIAYDITLLLGVCLVLLAPCIDYVIVFTHLGKGDAKLMLAATPILFITQMIFLPVYLMLFINKEAAALIQIKPFVATFLLLI